MCSKALVFLYTFSLLLKEFFIGQKQGFKQRETELVLHLGSRTRKVHFILILLQLSGFQELL